MPTITRQDGRRVNDPAEAATIIGALGLTVSRFAHPLPIELEPVLERQRLDSWRAEVILSELSPHLPSGHMGRDVVALFPFSDGLDAIQANFRRIHVHEDDEIRLILAGEGVFGFILPQGEQVELTVTSGDLLGVPAGTEHWFRLTESRTLVAVRLFNANRGWRLRALQTKSRH